MATLTLFLAGFAMALMCVDIYQLWTFVEAVHVRGMGRILFLALSSLKLWTLLVVIYFIVNSFDPFLLGAADSNLRDGIRLFFAAYLFGQTLGTTTAIGRWKREDGGDT